MRRFLASSLTTLLLLLPFFAFASTQAVLTGTVLQGTDAAGTTHTISLNLDGSGSNLALFCVMEIDSGAGAFKTSTWNGAATTTSVAHAGAQLSGSEMDVWTNPTTGTHNLVVNLTVSKALAYTCFTFANVKQTATLDVSGANNNGASGTSASTASVTSSSASSFLIGWQLSNSTATALANTDGTAIGTALTVPAGYKLFVSWKSATGGADTLSYSWTNSVNWDNWSDSFFDQAPTAAVDNTYFSAFWW